MSDKNIRNLIFMTFSMTGLILFFESLKELIGLSFQERLYSHFVLIPLVSLYLTYWKRKLIFSTMTYSYREGMSVAAAAILLYLVGTYYALELNKNDYLFVMTLAALLWFIGGFITSYGIHAFRGGIFPFIFLIFMVPIPTIILKPLTKLFQISSTETSYVLFKLTGTPIFRDGFVFSLPGINISVSEGCAGLRGFLALFIIGILSGYLFLQTVSRKLLLLLVILPLETFRNAVRIVTISLMAAYVDPTWLTNGILHGQSGGLGGKLSFIMSLFFFALILRFLKRGEGQKLNKSYQNTTEVRIRANSGRHDVMYK